MVCHCLLGAASCLSDAAVYSSMMAVNPSLAANRPSCHPESEVHGVVRLKVPEFQKHLATNRLNQAVLPGVHNLGFKSHGNSYRYKTQITVASYIKPELL